MGDASGKANRAMGNAGGPIAGYCLAFPCCLVLSQSFEDAISKEQFQKYSLEPETLTAVQSENLINGTDHGGYLFLGPGDAYEK